MSLLDSVKHVEGVHLWHLLIDELHMEDVIAVSLKGHAVGLCAICCKKAVTLCSGEEMKTLRQWGSQPTGMLPGTMQPHWPRWCSWPSMLQSLTPPSPCGSFPHVGSSRLSIAVPYGSTWQSYVAVLPFGTAMALLCRRTRKGSRISLFCCKLPCMWRQESPRHGYRWLPKFPSTLMN